MNRVDDAATVASAQTGPASEDLSSSSSLWPRFTPGTLFAGRFRIVAPLGRGGMGEVYRADDLRLGQTVALKLLPDNLSHDPGRLAQFHNEVRVARTIAHRNVCRTYDIGDADGRPFMTMEYVDGEDLASLLRRIGRFPQDKAIEVARQICAGLAAAHEKGVLHRDLKPANVMIDGDGHARLTDFGLASLGGAVDNIRSGTPAYMAPETLAGKEVTERSDIYALGLVLFELFTGKRVFEANTLKELISLHESSSIASPSSVVRDLDAAVERTILRCLEHDPAKRPPSALAVSAGLPGGDQLAAALAAGETPSPEMVAAAGEQSAIQPAFGLVLVAFTIVMIGVLAVLSERYSVIHHIPLPRSTDSLKDRAQEILERIGYTEPAADAVWGWSGFSRAYLSYPERERTRDDPWPALSSGRTGTATFWYRTSPAALVPSYAQMLPLENDPPMTLSEMRLVKVDAHGRLVEFQSIPPQVDADAAAGTADWGPLFEAAALPFGQFHEVTPQWRSRADADERKAWSGPLPGVPNTTVRIEAAASAGRPIFFGVIAPWTVPTRMVSAARTERLAERVVTLIAAIIGTVLLAGAALLARRNLRSGHGDRRGAFRTAAIVFICQAVGWMIRARHYGDIGIEWLRISGIIAPSLLSALIAWLSYIALEPYVRRFWPQLLIGWTRLLSGRVRDPLVGRDFLVGVASGMIASLLIGLLNLVPRLLNREAPPLLPLSLMLLGSRYAIASALGVVMPAFNNAIQCLAVAVFLRILVKRTWLVFTLSMLLILPIAMNNLFTGENAVLQMPIFLLGVAMMFFILLRFGLLALVVAFFTMNLGEIFPLTLTMTRPYAGTSVVLMLGIAALSAYGYYASRGNEPLFGRDFLEQN
jgi:serine/threonine protein kinase